MTTPEDLNDFQGFSTEEQNESKIIVRLSKIEEDNIRLSQDMKELMVLVKRWRSRVCSKDDETQPSVMKELRDIRVREEQRDKENKKLRDQVEKLEEQNNKNRKEITALYEENQELRHTLSRVGYDEDKS